jgi:hypothetical protein
MDAKQAKTGKSSTQQVLIDTIAEFADGTIMLKSDLNLLVTLKCYKVAGVNSLESLLQTMKFERHADKTLSMRYSGRMGTLTKSLICPQNSLPAALPLLLHKDAGRIDVSPFLRQLPFIFESDESFNLADRKDRKDRMKQIAEIGTHVEQIFETLHGFSLVDN